jgi:hypothetical protein
MNRANITPRPQLAHVYRTAANQAAPGNGFGPVTAMTFGLLRLVPSPAVPLPNGPGFVTPMVFGLLDLVPWPGARAGNTA